MGSEGGSIHCIGVKLIHKGFRISAIRFMRLTRNLQET